ncbi:MAG TPA: hypothetical protein VGF48_15475 [Thermoanaerobaculia bacterium]|jgi:hypothetical protein
MRRLLPFLLLALAACATDTTDDYTRVRTSERGRYGEEAGTFSVGSIPDVILRDDVRNRDVRLTIDYPINVTQAQPLILLAPEEGSTNRGYVGVAAYWTSFGYNVIRLAHGEAGDVTFVLNSLDRLERDYPELAGKIDRAKIGLAGHAAGALSAIRLGGTDPRIKAIVAMSPAGPGGASGLTNEAFAALRLPAMFLTGTRDVTETETLEWRQQAFQLAPAGDKWLVTLEGGGPMAFSGRATPPPAHVDRRDEYDPFTGQRRVDPRSSRGQALFIEERTTFHLVRSLTLGFWDLYLRGDAAGREYLTRADARDDAVVQQR